MISHKLNIPFKPVHASTRDFPHWENYLPKSNDSKVLIVDDICDSGLTIKQIKELVPNSRWAVLHQKADIELEYTAQNLYNDDRWVVYPWEETV